MQPERVIQQTEEPAGEVTAASRDDRLRALALQGETARGEVRRFLARARSRARGLALVRLLCVLLAGLLAALLVGVGAAALLGMLWGRVVLALAAAGALGAALLFQRRSALQRAATAASDPVRLARLLCDPALGDQGGGSELLSSVELSQRPAPGASEELLSLLHVRASARAQGLRLEALLPSKSLKFPGFFLGTAVLCGLIAGLVVPKKLWLGTARLLGEADELALVDAEPIAGDLVITYLYPPHTGLPPRTEEGTSGELKGPKGTEVRLAARADRDVAQAFAVVNGTAQRLDAGGPGNRQLSGGFVLRAAGKWRLRFTDQKGRAVAEGPSLPVELVADRAPQVTIDAPEKRELEVDPQGKLVVAWSASDDYGLTKAALVVQKAGEPEVRIPLQSAAAGDVRARRMRGAYTWELSTLGLRAGDKVSFLVEAFDNDGVDGSKRGVSQTRSLKIFSAAEHHREALLRAQALWERLVLLLADRLDETVAQLPATEALAQPWFARTGARDRDAQALVAELSKAGRELMKDKLAPKELGLALKNVAGSLSGPVSRTQVARVPLAKGAGGREGAGRFFASALGNEVRELEKDVLYLEDLFDRARLDDLKELQQELKASRRELMRLAEQLRKAPDEATKKQLLAEVARLRERVQELMRRMGEMAKGIRDEHLNREAVETMEKQRDLMAQLADVQKKMQDGKIDEALKQLDELSQQMDELEKSLDDQADEQQGEQYAEEAKALREAKESLEKLKGREQALEKRTAEVRRQLHEEARKRFEQRGGKELAKKLLAKVEKAKKSLAQLDPKTVVQTGLDEALDLAQERTEDLKRALAANDWEEALDQAQRAERAVQGMSNRLAVEEQIQAGRLGSFGRDPVTLRASGQAAANARAPLAEVVRELQDALPREGEGQSPGQQQELKSQAGEQRSIREGFGEVKDKLGEVGKKVPIFSPRHEQTLREIGEGMQRAESKLGQLEPRGGQAGEQQALEKLDAFEQAMKELAKGGKGGKSGKGGLPMPWGEPRGQGEGGDEEGDDATSNEKVEIPDAESGRGPQEFRKKLLDAMKQPPPDKFKDRVKQYYEELVK